MVKQDSKSIRRNLKFRNWGLVKTSKLMFGQNVDVVEDVKGALYLQKVAKWLKLCPKMSQRNSSWDLKASRKVL